MGRASKFAFPLPGRKTNVTVDRPHDDPNYHNLAVPVDQWSPRTVEPSSFSKAERLLGTSSFPFRPSSRNQSPVPPTSPAYMTVSVSEASFETSYTGNMSSPGLNEANLYPHQRPGLSKRPSSNVLGSGFQDAVRTGSQSSSVSHRLVPQTSNSTLRSYYDPQKSPLSVSQQTSASAVRDMGLRKGKPIVAHDPDHTLRPSSRQAADDLKKQYRKSKPTRLDLSKLFPKPRGNGVDHSVPPLLSPNKLVNSPSALSSTSEYFPRPMTREPTPTPNPSASTKPRAKLIKSPKLHQDPSLHSAPRSSSPTRLYERDTYDNAKIHVRRPPRGIQHWFDALGESDEDEEEDEQPPAPHPPYRNGPHSGLIKKSSAPHLGSHATGQARESHLSPRRGDAFKHDVYGQSSIYPSHSLHSPNHFSTHSQTSLGTCKTKESAFSRSNLQDASVLSFSSSSEDEEDQGHRKASNPFKARESIECTDCQGEIIIGKAQAYDIRPFSPGRRTSESKLSMRTTSTSAATIEVMYTPEPYYPQTFPRPSGYGSRRSSHVRQPSIIPEDASEDVRPKTSTQRSMSPSASVRSGRTSASEPRRNGHKLMAVTEEEEALLEMMRRKRAAMAKHSFAEGYKTALSQESRQKTPPETKSHRTSAFLTNETPAGSPARAAKPASRNSTTSSPLLQPPPRGRPSRSTQDVTAGASVLQDNSSCDDASSRRSPPSPLAINRHQLSPPPEFSPLDIFPSPAATPPEASIASPTTTDHPSPIPSPITPGLRQGETEVDVKVAGSEPSCNGDNEEVPVLETGVIHPPSGSLKPSENGSHAPAHPQHLRRRTASSDANVTLSPVLRAFPKADGQTSGVAMESHDLAPVSEASSRPPSIVVDPQLPRKSSRRFNNALKVNTMTSVSRNSSLYSARTSSPARGSRERQTSKAASRGSSISSGKRDSFAVGSSTRCSVSEDVLAAWGSLGGWRDFDSGRAM